MSCGCLPRSAYFTQTRRNRASSRYCSNRVSRSSRVHRSSRGNTSVSRPPEVNVCSAHLMKRTQTSRGSSPAYVASASQKALWCRGKRGAARSAAEGKEKGAHVFTGSPVQGQNRRSSLLVSRIGDLSRGGRVPPLLLDLARALTLRHSRHLRENLRLAPLPQGLEVLLGRVPRRVVRHLARVSSVLPKAHGRRSPARDSVAARRERRSRGRARHT